MSFHLDELESIVNLNNVERSLLYTLGAGCKQHASQATFLKATNKPIYQKDCTNAE